MREEELWKAIGELDDDIVQKARLPKQTSRGRWKSVKWAAVAACLCLTVFGAHAIVAEAEETREAIDYFNAEGLSTEGLTRGEIKAVYKDIKTESYSLPLTTELLAKRLAEADYVEEPIRIPEIEPKGGVALAGLVKVGEDTEAYCNTEANVLLGDEGNGVPNLVCHDPVYGITYYINSGSGRDCYIYAFRDGSSELAVALPAQTLYCRDGKVYFLAMGGPGTGNTYTGYNLDEVGRIFSYNPVDGTVEQVLERNRVVRMRVYPDGIHFAELESYGKGVMEGGMEFYHSGMKYFYYSFATGEITGQEVMSTSRAGEWLMKTVGGDVPRRNKEGEEYEVVGIVGYDFFNLSGEKAAHFDTMPYATYSFRISGEKLYYIENRNPAASWLMEYDLTTGERKELYEIGQSYPTWGPILFGNALYTTGNLRMDLTDGSCSYLMMPLSASDQSYRAAWYTDGENLFYFSGSRMYLYKETPKEHGRQLDFSVGSFSWEYDIELVPLGK